MDGKGACLYAARSHTWHKGGRSNVPLEARSRQSKVARWSIQQTTLPRVMSRGRSTELRGAASSVDVQGRLVCGLSDSPGRSRKAGADGGKRG